MKTFVIGDIHGQFKALKNVLKKSKFNYNNDKLIVLGDIVDGGPRTYEVVEELLKIKNIVYIIGNHDEWFMNHIKSGWTEEIWLQQGGVNTLKSYGAKVVEGKNMSEDSLVNTKKLNIPVTHQEFFNRGIYYYMQDDILFVHGGINPKILKIESQSKFDLVWDRDLIFYAKEHKIENYKHIFVGHTTTQYIANDLLQDDIYVPLTLHNLTMMDTGAGFSRRLSIMNIHTRKYWQSKIQGGSR